MRQYRDVLARSSVTFDDIGRLSGEYTLLPGVTEDGPWNQRLHGYDGLSREIWVTEWQELGAAELHKTEYVYDRFDRPTVITPPDGACHKVSLSYAGDRQVERTAKVATWRSGWTVNEDERERIDQEFDILGNLWKLTEPAGPAGEDVENDLQSGRRRSIAEGVDALGRVYPAPDVDVRRARFPAVGDRAGEVQRHGVVLEPQRARTRPAPSPTVPTNSCTSTTRPGGSNPSQTSSPTRDRSRVDLFDRERQLSQRPGAGEAEDGQGGEPLLCEPGRSGRLRGRGIVHYGGMDGRPSRRKTIAGIEAGCGLEEFNVEFRWTPLGDIDEIEFPEARRRRRKWWIDSAPKPVRVRLHHGRSSEVDYEVDHYPDPRSHPSPTIPTSR